MLILFVFFHHSPSGENDKGRPETENSNENTDANKVIQEENVSSVEPSKTTSSPLLSPSKTSSPNSNSTPKRYGAINDANHSTNSSNVDFNSSVTGMCSMK